ncbi:hypothetical protein DPEC_G00279550 [Dallia pectoralis]|uniref:Uncharacterized protein n=1 Tax=Dallia pectoralis TaxID=75939 RepID=A0ACC2FMK9_DALPE|nr:hypothetical protein DPEC_G00279550 [Dallia pectoralis]
MDRWNRQGMGPFRGERGSLQKGGPALLCARLVLSGGARPCVAGFANQDGGCTEKKTTKVRYSKQRDDVPQVHRSFCEARGRKRGTRESMRHNPDPYGCHQCLHLSVEETQH